MGTEKKSLTFYTMPFFLSDRNGIRTHNHLVGERTLNHLAKWSSHFAIGPVWLHGWVFVYTQSGFEFDSRWCHLNFRYGAWFEQGVPWHSSELWSVDLLWKLYVTW